MCLFNHGSIQHLPLARYHGAWCDLLGQKMFCGFCLQKCSSQQGPGFRGGEGESPRFLETVGFEPLERWVEFWQIEAEGGVNARARKVGKFDVYWGMFDYSRTFVKKGLVRKQIFQHIECPAKYIDFSLWATRA